MLVQADLHIQSVLSSYLQALRHNAEAIDSIFSGLSSAQRLEIRTYVGSKTIPVKLGYPLSAADLPGVYITLGAFNETDQSIGGLLGDIETPLRFYEEGGAFYQLMVRCQCCATNSDLTVWLQNIIHAGLLAHRLTLSKLGITQQKLGASDFQPYPPMFPDPAYRRDVTLSAQVGMSVPQEVLKIVNIEITSKAIEADVQPKVFRL